MMQIGLNHRLCVPHAFKDQTRAMYEGVFAATITSPRPDVEIITFADGSGIGVFYVDPADALTPEEHRKGLWLEFEVENEADTVAKLAALGIEAFEYFDEQHKYFQAPGGLVFRLAPPRRQSIEGSLR